MDQKRIMLVGNAPFSEDTCALIDDYDVVVRFNLFEKEWFKAGLCGRKIDYWCVNLGTGRKSPRKRREHDRYCHLVKELNPSITVITPYEEDRHRRLQDVKRYYPERGIEIIYPDRGLPTGLRKQPSVGFYMAFRLVAEGIPVSVIGYTGETSKRHDGVAEIEILRNHSLIVFHETP